MGRNQLIGVAVLSAVALRAAAAWVSSGEPQADVATFLSWAMHLDSGENPYATTVQSANYPPLWLHLCWGCLKVAQRTGLGFDLLIKLLVSLTDASSVLAIGLLAAGRGAAPGLASRAAIGYAINPVAILISAFHAQNDPVVLALVLWSSWLVLRQPVRHAGELAMILLGISLTIKPIALLFLPLFLAQASTWQRRFLWLLLLCLIAALCSLPYGVRSPELLFRAFLSYQGTPDFGYVGIYNSWANLGLGSSGTPVIEVLPAELRVFCLGTLGLVWYYFRRSDLMEQIQAFVLSLYLMYGTLAAQYLLWLIPLAAVTLAPQLLRGSLLAAIALIAFYQLHHPGVLTGSALEPLNTGISIPQWSGVFLFAQLLLYVHWIRWMRDQLLRSHGGRGGAELLKDHSGPPG